MKYESFRDDVEKQLKDRQKLAAEAIGQLVKGDAVQKTPVAERHGGNLKKSNKHEVKDTIVKLGNTAEYAAYVHEGTRYMTGRPFLYQAVTENRNNIKRLVEQYLKG